MRDLSRNVVGLIGAAGAGKTELAKLLVEQAGYRRVHMGQPIKDMLLALGISEHQLTGPPRVRDEPLALLDGKSARYAMQMLGTDWGRHKISPSIWANAVERRLIEIRQSGTGPIIIDDLRFPEDCALVRRLNGMIVRVIRPGVSLKRKTIDRVAHRFPKTRRAMTSLGFRPIHESEYYWHDAHVDFTITNNDSSVALFEKFQSQFLRL